MSLRSNVRRAAGASVATAAVGLCALGNSVAIAFYWGASATTDSFFMAAAVLDIATKALLVNQLGAVYTRQFADSYQQDPQQATRDASATAVGLLVALSAIALLISLFAAPIVGTVAPGFGPDRRAETVRWVLIWIWVFPLEGLSTSILAVVQRVRGDYVTPMLVTALQPAFSLAAVFIFGTRYGLLPLVSARLVGAALGCAIQIARLRPHGWSVFTRPRLFSGQLPALVRLTGPMALISGSSALAGWAVRAVASTLGPGVFAAFSFGSAGATTASAVLTQGIDGVSLTELSKRVARGTTDEVRSASLFAETWIGTFVLLIFPVAAFAIAVAPSVLHLLYDHGAFAATGGIDVALPVFQALMLNAAATQLAQIALYNTAMSLHATKRLGVIFLGRYALWAGLVLVVGSRHSYWILVWPQILIAILDLVVFRRSIVHADAIRAAQERVWRRYHAVAILILIALLLASMSVFAAVQPLTTLGHVLFIAVAGVSWVAAYWATLVRVAPQWLPTRLRPA